MFLVIIPIFLALCVLFAYLYAYVPFGVLNLSKRLSVRISFFIFYAIFTLLIAFARLDIVVLSPYAIAIVILSILILKRKGYFTNFTKARVAMAGACLLVFTWQLEMPQRLIVNFFGLKINITDNNYVVLEHKVWNMKDNILVTNWVQYHNFLNYISFDKADIFICDEIDCKGNKKKIGEISMPSMPRSTLGCINLTGRCLGVINPPGLEIETFRNYLKEQSIKKTINKLN